jgi:hypothetical protein
MLSSVTERMIHKLPSVSKGRFGGLEKGMLAARDRKLERMSSASNTQKHAHLTPFVRNGRI